MNLIISFCREIALAGAKRVSEWNGKCVRVRGLETDRVQEKCRSMFGGRFFCFLLPSQRAIDRGTESVNNAILQKISVRGSGCPAFLSSSWKLSCSNALLSFAEPL